MYGGGDHGKGTKRTTAFSWVFNWWGLHDPGRGVIDEQCL